MAQESGRPTEDLGPQVDDATETTTAEEPQENAAAAESAAVSDLPGHPNLVSGEHNQKLAPTPEGKERVYDPVAEDRYPEYQGEQK